MPCCELDQVDGVEANHCHSRNNKKESDSNSIGRAYMFNVAEEDLSYTSTSENGEYLGKMLK